MQGYCLYQTKQWRVFNVWFYIDVNSLCFYRMIFFNFIEKSNITLPPIVELSKLTFFCGYALGISLDFLTSYVETPEGLMEFYYSKVWFVIHGIVFILAFVTLWHRFYKSNVRFVNVTTGELVEKLEEEKDADI